MKYKRLDQQEFSSGDFKLVPIRYEDRYKIMQWRNEQMYHLRQAEPLTKEKQDAYFENVVAKLFDQEQPSQILFSFLKDNECIGYGGLVHINWNSKNAEISFLLDTTKNSKDEYLYKFDIYLKMIELIGRDIRLEKIYTYGYDIDEYRFVPLCRNSFEMEAYLHEQVLVNKLLIGVRIYSKILKYD